MSETGLRVDPYRNYNFLVELDGVERASFQECNGLQVATEIIEYREGGDNSTVRKMPGRTSYTDIVLRFGVTESDELWSWHQAVVAGQDMRKNGSVVVFDLANSTEILRWNFFRAWPTQWEGPSFDATANAIAIESLTLAHEGLLKA